MSDNKPERFEAQVRCVTCKEARWIDYARRHEGSRRAVDVKDFTARCPKASCPRGQDFTEWTGHVRPKEGAWKDADDTTGDVFPPPNYGWFV